MKYHVTHKASAWHTPFTIKNAAGRDCYAVYGESWTSGRTLLLTDMQGVQLAEMRGGFGWVPTYEILQNDIMVAELEQRCSLLKGTMNVKGPAWSASWGLNAAPISVVDRYGSTIAFVSEELMTSDESYSVEIPLGEPEALLLSVVLAIDVTLEAAFAHLTPREPALRVG